MKVFVLGGDGYCGWPAALHLSSRGDDITIVDNLSRRRLDHELGIASLSPICTMEERRNAWRDVSGKQLGFARLDLARDYEAFCNLLVTERPDAIVHLAEQRSVPYSMLSPATRRYTIENNLGATHNVLAALVESGLDSHLVHLSSVGIYGYETLGYCVPEGYAKVNIMGASGSGDAREVLHPMNPVSIYHLTKAQDQLALAFYSKNDGVRITDLVQGTVWGSETPETARDERLVNRFDYDSVFGTVINRFVLQAALRRPLTIYGSGQQTRAFIQIGDVMRCIAMALDNPPQRGERMRVFNQIAETRRIADIASLVARCWPGTEVKAVDNPRNEPPRNDLELNNAQLVSLGFSPQKIDHRLLGEVMELAERYKSRCDQSAILP
jgi:UDP-sulfoquinovose synthase